MAMVAGKAVINIYPSMSGFKSNVDKELNGIKATATSTSMHIGNGLKKAFAIGAAAVAAVGAAIIKFGKDSLEAFNTAAEAQAKLEQTAKNQNWYEGATDDLRKYNAELQKLGIIEDDVLAAGQAQLGTFALSAESVKKLTPALADLVAATKGYGASADDASNMANLLGKAYQGNVGALTRYGVTLTDAQKKIIETGTEEEKVAAITEVIAANYGGFNEALANTPEGAVEQLKNSFGDLQETIGEKLAPTIQKVIVPAVQKLAEKFADFMAKPEVERFFDLMLDFADFALIQGFDALTEVFDTLADGAGDVADIVDDIKNTLKDMGFTEAQLESLSFGKVVGQALGVVIKVAGLGLMAYLKLTQGIAHATQTIREKIDHFAHSPAGMALIDLFQKTGDKVRDMRDAASDAFNKIKEKAKPIIDALEPVKEMFEEIKKKIEELTKPITDTADRVKNAFSWAFTDVRTQSNTTSNTVKSNAQTTQTSISGAFNQMKTNVTSAFAQTNSQAQSHLKQIPNGANGAKTSIASKFAGTATAVKNQIGSTNGIGSAIVSGIVYGINATKSGIGSALVSGVVSAIEAAKARIRSNSPSKLTRDVIGKPIMQGVAVGIQTETGLVGSTFADSLTDALQYTYSVDYPSTVNVGMGATAGVKVVNQTVNLYETNPAAVAQVLEARQNAALGV